MTSPKALNQLISPYGNCERIAYEFCKKLEVQVTRTYLQQQLEEHPAYPSLLAINDVLTYYGIENIAGKIELKEILKVPCPFIAQVKIQRREYFTVVSATSDLSVLFFHPIEERFKKATIEDFGKLFCGIFLIGEKAKFAGEKDYFKNLLEEKRKRAKKMFLIFSLPILVVALCAVTLISSGSKSVPSVCYTLLTLAGSIVCTLLLWYEVDNHNPMLQQICTGGQKTNCNAVLNSGASKIWGISWSVIGFTYFIGSLITLLVSGIYNPPVLLILSWLNVSVLPYIIFSIYYQLKIAKQWCVLCVTIQLILASQFLVAAFGYFHSAIQLSLIPLSSFYTTVTSFLIPPVVTALLLPSLRIAKQGKQNNKRLLRFKHDAKVFEALLGKQKAIKASTEGLGILLGNPQATHRLIKVCNPYCGPCANAHHPIEELLKNNQDLQVQIIFTATGEENDHKTPPVQHLLAIAANGNEEVTRKALDDWYMSKDYLQFASKYPLTGKLHLQNEKIKLMRDWCGAAEILFTPTFFINGFQLPDLYTVADLKYFLTV
jgi:uncharacterized membrane protein